ncbi:FG-GAP repeat domain-containing protein [Desulfatitalea alkaliphila]|uniref:VCBS repeat-containing protein n=1 Tax=Desulfatitalea alkaliphila TaxID=2929485 RepID=A0AA41R734_9BACT|nr:VCBS repeat-containing protein [Desulfatitalea alkaliphila]MCJ8502430.1 VCBS repeat-containing protein [Desulfatitalea alkaliphila]
MVFLIGGFPNTRTCKGNQCTSGVWWFAVGLIVALGLVFGCSGGGTADNSAQKDGVATETIPSAVSLPVLRQTLPASWDENWFASTAVFDLTGDGRQEIIAARHSVLYVWTPSGEMLWRAPVGESATSANDHGLHRQYASPVVGDLNGNGAGEIAIAFSNRVALYDHKGDLLPGWPQAFPDAEDEIRSIAAVDLDNDGLLEILAQKTGPGPVTMAWRLDGTMVPGWPQAVDCAECNQYGGYNQNIGAADLTGDGLPEVVSTYDCSYVGIMSSDGTPLRADTSLYTGPYVSSVPMFHDISLAARGWGADGSDRDEFTASPPVFADMDGDGILDLIVYSDRERAGEPVVRGNCLWAFKADLTRVPGFENPICSGEPLSVDYRNNIVRICPAPAVGQFTIERRPAIVVPSYDGVMRCYGAAGALLWAYRFDAPGGHFIGASGAALGDLDDDGIPEVVFTTYSTAQGVSHLIILNAAGALLHRVPIPGRGAMSVPTLADVEGDGILEIVISLKDQLGGGLGGVQIYDVPSAVAGYLPWPTGRGNLLRNGQGY